MPDYRHKLRAILLKPFGGSHLGEALGDVVDVGGHDDDKTIEPDDDNIKVPIPSLGQQDDYTCAAGALRPIFKYFGVGPDPDEETAYKDGLHADPENGTPPTELVEFAKEWGLQVVAKNGMALREVISFLNDGKPVVCAIQAWGTPETYRKERNGHYVTAIGYDDKHLICHDPAIKQNLGYIDFDDFESRWFDREADGTEYSQWGMAVWLPDNEEPQRREEPVAVSPLKKAREIE